MGTHMKTTIEISDALLAEARRVAEKERTTLRALIEAGLRGVLASKKRRQTFSLRRVTFRGEGLVSELEGEAWDRIRERAYEGRGG